VAVGTLEVSSPEIGAPGGDERGLLIFDEAAGDPVEHP
jgi:hypothetical protein